MSPRQIERIWPVRTDNRVDPPVVANDKTYPYGAEVWRVQLNLDDAVVVLNAGGDSDWFRNSGVIDSARSLSRVVVLEDYSA